MLRYTPGKASPLLVDDATTCTSLSTLFAVTIFNLLDYSLIALFCIGLFKVLIKFDAPT